MSNADFSHNYNPLSRLFLLHFLTLLYALRLCPEGPCWDSYAQRMQQTFLLVIMFILEKNKHEIRGRLSTITRFHW